MDRFGDQKNETEKTKPLAARQRTVCYLCICMTGFSSLCCCGVAAGRPVVHREIFADDITASGSRTDYNHSFDMWQQMFSLLFCFVFLRNINRRKRQKRPMKSVRSIGRCVARDTLSCMPNYFIQWCGLVLRWPRVPSATHFARLNQRQAHAHYFSFAMHGRSTVRLPT